MTKTQVIRLMAEQMNVSPKLVTGFFDLLIKAATSETRKAGEFMIPGLGKLVRLSEQPGRAATPGTGESIKIARPGRSSIQGFQSCQDAVVPSKKYLNQDESAGGEGSRFFPRGAGRRAKFGI